MCSATRQAREYKLLISIVHPLGANAPNSTCPYSIHLDPQTQTFTSARAGFPVCSEVGQALSPNTAYFLNRPCRAGASAPPSAFRPTRFWEEFAVIHRQKCQLRSERKLGRKAEALPPRKPAEKSMRYWALSPDLNAPAKRSVGSVFGVFRVRADGQERP
jgi:hypothetical protein